MRSEALWSLLFIPLSLHRKDFKDQSSPAPQLSSFIRLIKAAYAVRSAVEKPMNNSIKRLFIRELVQDQRVNNAENLIGRVKRRMEAVSSRNLFNQSALTLSKSFFLVI